MATIDTWPSPYTPGLVEALGTAGLTIWANNDGTMMCRDGDLDAVKTAIAAFAGSASELAFAKAQKLATLATIYAGKYTAGRVYNSVTYQIDADSQGNITGSGALAAQVIAGTTGVNAWPTGFYWIAADNSHTSMDAAAMFAFAQDIAGYVTTLIVTNRAFKDAIDAATDKATIDAIDVTAGWPSNG